MNFTVVNRGLSVGNIRVTGVATSSVLLIGDANEIHCTSAYDTPPESLIIGADTTPAVPLAQAREDEVET